MTAGIVRNSTQVTLSVIQITAGGYCGTSLLVWTLQAKTVPQVSGTGKSCKGALLVMGGWLGG